MRFSLLAAVSLVFLSLVACKGESEPEPSQNDDAGTCGPDPSKDGCSDNADCTGGKVCARAEGCLSSSCSCGADGWTCTADCGERHACVDKQAATTCTGNDPSIDGCTLDTDCAAGETCEVSAQSGCRPSSCGCGTGGGSWACTEDCGEYHVCKPKPAK